MQARAISAAASCGPLPPVADGWRLPARKMLCFSANLACLYSATLG